MVAKKIPKKVVAKKPVKKAAAAGASGAAGPFMAVFLSLPWVGVAAGQLGQ